MSYDPTRMFNDIAPRSEAPKVAWFPCPVCTREYATAALAKGCREAHARYGRQATTMFPDVPVPAPEARRKAEVFIALSGERICGLCASKGKGDDLYRVEMLEPPACGKCGKPIEPEPEKLIDFRGNLPPSERWENRRLAPTRRALAERMRAAFHRDLTGVGARSVAGDIPEEA